MEYDKLLEHRCFELEEHNSELMDRILKLESLFDNEFELSFRLLVESSLRNRERNRNMMKQYSYDKWLLEWATIQFMGSRQSGHTTLIKRVLPDYFKSILMVVPSSWMVSHLSCDPEYSLFNIDIRQINNISKYLYGKRYDCIVLDSIDNLEGWKKCIFDIVRYNFSDYRGTLVSLQGYFYK